METILSINDDVIRKQIEQLDYFVVLTTGEISFDSCLEDPEMVAHICVPGYVAFAERLRFFAKLPMNRYLNDTNIRGPIMFRKIGKETPIENRPQTRIRFHFDRPVCQTSLNKEGLFHPVPLILKHTGVNL